MHIQAYFSIFAKCACFIQPSSIAGSLKLDSVITLAGHVQVASDSRTVYY